MSKRSKDSQEAFNRIAAAANKYTDTKEICYGRRVKRPYVQDHFIKRAYVCKIADYEPATSR